MFRPFLLLLAMSWSAGFAAESGRRPNILILLTDDQGWGDVGFNGNTAVATPHLDALARSGARLDRFYVSPVCSPTRAELLTGRYHTRTGVTGVQNGNERLNLGEHTMAETFRAAGYATGLFGKWHNGAQGPYHPNARGFEEFYGFTQGHWPSYFDAEIERNGRRIRSRGFLADDLTDHAAKFIAAHRDRPFLCFLSLPTPHTPLQVPEKYWAKFARRDLRQRGLADQTEEPDFTRAVLAMTENIDDNVGRLTRRLVELGLGDNTIVIYFSDNGPNSWRWNGGMKGRKASTDEGGVRSPGVIRWPGRITPGMVVRQNTSVLDLFPTLTDFAGLAPGGELPLDGTSLRPLLAPGNGTAASWPDRTLFAEWGGKVSARFQHYMLDAEGALFDLAADPAQMKNIAGENPSLVTQLTQAVAIWKRDAMPLRAETVRPFPVGHAAMPVAELAAGDGMPHDGVKRSARWPNSSFFTDWTTTAGRMTWPIEVATAGRYRVEIYYACSAADVGATVEVSVGASRVSAKLLVPNDPPLIGAAADRVPRVESYTKDFRPFEVGVFELPAGRGDLTLRALDIPGAQAMEVQAVVLTLQP